MEIHSEGIIALARTIKHPELGVDIVSLGMVNDIIVSNSNVALTLKLVKPNDPFASSLRKALEKAISKQFGQDVAIKVTVQVPVAQPKESPYKTQASVSRVKNIIGVASGKGGVGKSTIAVNLAVAMSQKGYKVGLIDSDIFGPSIPKMFGTEQLRPNMIKEGDLELIEPVEQYGVKHLSIGYFVSATDALVWRGPMATNALKQLIHQGAWGELDFLFIDMPPGTSDIHLTLVQELSITGVVIVSTPQDVALADAIKGISMFTGKSVNVPVLGLVENMAWFTPEELPDNKYYIFGKDGCKKLAERMRIPLLAQVPIVMGIREGGDNGVPAASGNTTLSQVFSNLAEKFIVEVEKRNKLAPTQKVEISKK